MNVALFDALCDIFSNNHRYSIKYILSPGFINLNNTVSNFSNSSSKFNNRSSSSSSQCLIMTA